MRPPLALFLAAFVVAAAPARGTLSLNAAQPITERVTVQVIVAASATGTNPAPAFGDATQQAAIFGAIDAIWAQAGIDIDFKFRSGTWNNDFALLGTTGSNNPRPTSDLDDLFTSAGAAGMLDPDPFVLNLVLVRIVPGFSQTSNNTSNGLAYLGDNGITLWAGPGLLTFTDGRDVIAGVLAHEIGHNLGLDHITTDDNLMDSPSTRGERLNAAQIATARSSAFSVPIPEPGTAALLALGSLAFAHRAGRRAPARD